MSSLLQDFKWQTILSRHLQLSVIDKKLAHVIGGELRRMKHKETIKNDIEMFTNLFLKQCGTTLPFPKSSKCNRVPEHLRRFVYCEGVRHGNTTAFESVLNAYSMARGGSMEERLNLLKALTCSEDVKRLEYLLYTSIDETGAQNEIRTNKPLLIENSFEAFEIFRGVAENPIGRQSFSQFLSKHFPAFITRLEYNSKAIQELIHKAFVSSDEDDIEKMKNLMRNNSEIGSDSLGKQILSRLSSAVETKRHWLDNSSKAVIMWFSVSVEEMK